MLSGTRLAVVTGAIVAVASCARDKRAPEHPVAAKAPPAQQPAPAAPRGDAPPAAPPLNRRAMMAVGDAGYESWIATVRECTPADVAGAKPHLPGLQADLARRKPAVSIEGRLMPGMPECNLMSCAPSPCCNGCSFEWVVVPRRDCPDRKLRVRLSSSPFALRGGGMDCAVLGYGRDADWVIVTGRIGGEGDIVGGADLCRLRSLTAIEAKDQLSDADYERLGSPATKRRKADNPPNCPPPPAAPVGPRPLPEPAPATPPDERALF